MPTVSQKSTDSSTIGQPSQDEGGLEDRVAGLEDGEQVEEDEDFEGDVVGGGGALSLVAPAQSGRDAKRLRRAYR